MPSFLTPKLSVLGTKWYFSFTDVWISINSPENEHFPLRDTIWPLRPYLPRPRPPLRTDLTANTPLTLCSSHTGSLSVPGIQHVLFLLHTIVHIVPFTRKALLPPSPVFLPAHPWVIASPVRSLLAFQTWVSPFVTSRYSICTSFLVRCITPAIPYKIYNGQGDMMCTEHHHIASTGHIVFTYIQASLKYWYSTCLNVVSSHSAWQYLHVWSVTKHFVKIFSIKQYVHENKQNQRALATCVGRTLHLFESMKIKKKCISLSVTMELFYLWTGSPKA